MRSSFTWKVVFAFAIGITLGSCGSDGGSQGPTGVNGDPQGGDFLTLSVGGAAAVMYNEASGLPNIDCDPRVDWSFYQVILWNQYTGGTGPSGYELFFEIMFPVTDSVGTYTVQGDWCQALFYDGSNYMASPLFSTSRGTVEVTRSDSRIEGNFDITVVDTAETASVDLTGSFGVDAGFSLSCP